MRAAYPPGRPSQAAAGGPSPRPSVQMPVQNPDFAEVLEGLATAIANAEQLVGDLESVPPPRTPAQAGDDAALVARGLERRLEAAESDRRELTARLVEAERRAERLMTLYVATYHLHAALDPPGVESAIAEIAVDLLGARRFVLLLEESDGTCRVAMDRTAGRREDVEAAAGPFAGGRYAGGEPTIDATLADGVLRIRGAEAGADGPVATVPLNLGGQTAGVLVLLELFEHKRGLTAEDRDLLDLLAAHAASALTAAQLFAVNERKLRTFRSLIELARPQDAAGGVAGDST
ncbi:MAG TPA: GAF domain-containing protein [Thermoanaerobaculia bacterium]